MEFAARSMRREFTYHVKTIDTRKWWVNELMRRMQIAIKHTGATFDGGVRSPPTDLKRWIVLASPHIDKCAMDTFEQATIKRKILFHTPLKLEVDDPNVRNAPYFIAGHLLDSTAIRIEESSPGLASLPEVFYVLQQARAKHAAAEIPEGQ